ncbi:hypothetical protein ATANTOWER_003705 [Ataeniobius toweri]|uniref:Tumor protein p53-inducible protein 11 n=1 Tax=Ataeniobius toweri TaxID=208326 RepID=A0ABU7CHJ3_9TELE|nr:hypothetical protein [Ataeniobius toweri]
MLGNELKFAVREPIGLRVWILISAVGFTVMAVTALVFPNQLYELVFEEELFTTSISVRLYGAALLSKYQNALNRKEDMQKAPKVPSCAVTVLNAFTILTHTVF